MVLYGRSVELVDSLGGVVAPVVVAVVAFGSVHCLGSICRGGGRADGEELELVRFGFQVDIGR
jgi:hypothetical protein